ncbi:hypothetical protein KZZ52_46145 [Dactylosporangium sp. AC04546]|uniref:hypothetical protein n=1 Tax=Dactylosporangium sp. AC04546 TaxID=2862460 RepID=UPI001EDFBB26|nr:hypothetical protein [Dactylosporangium sp. AC04546]WVK81296.1 hypothetical protein KZZ52_46145 [Dactylosporangium sp. AC04546]
MPRPVAVGGDPNEAGVGRLGQPVQQPGRLMAERRGGIGAGTTVPAWAGDPATGRP